MTATNLEREKNYYKRTVKTFYSSIYYSKPPFIGHIEQAEILKKCGLTDNEIDSLRIEAEQEWSMELKEDEQEEKNLATNNIVYLADRQNGVHAYCPELQERKPVTKMEADLAYGGGHYFIATPYELKGRGIKKIRQSWSKGSRKDLENWFSYLVTRKAYEKLKTQYSITKRCFLD